MAATYSAMTIAKWFVAWAEAEDADLSNLKLQKLLYYAQGHRLASTGEPLFRDRVLAWSHGPVVQDVYHHFKQFGSSDLRLAQADPFEWDDIDADTTDFLIRVWNTYAGFSAWRLRNMTHQEQPWRAHFDPEGYNPVIPTSDIQAFFKSRAVIA